MTEQQVKDFLQSNEAKAVLTLIAWTIGKTKTTKDDEIIDVIAGYADLIAEELEAIAAEQPTDDDAKEAGLTILKKIAAETETTWDDFIVKILDKVV